MRIKVMKVMMTLVASAVASAVAADPLLVGYAPKDGYVAAWFYDPAHLQRHKDYVKVWTTTIRANNDGVVDVEGVAVTKALMVINCRARTMGPKAIAQYSANDTLVSNDEVPVREIEFSSAIPGTIGESLMHEVCKKGPQL